MQFLIYWEINERMTTEHNQEIAETLTDGGHFPPEGLELVRWDSTPDGWGIAIVEADDVATVSKGLNMWRAAAGETAFFETTKTAPALPVEEYLPHQAALLEELA